MADDASGSPAEPVTEHLYADGVAMVQLLGPQDRLLRVVERERLGFGRRLQPIEVCVRHRHGEIGIGLHQREGRAWHLNRRPCRRADKMTRKGGFTRPKVTLKANNVTCPQKRQQASRKQRIPAFFQDHRCTH